MGDITLTSLLQDGNTVAWYQPGVGVTGTLNASAWANQMGVAGSLLQASGAAQPIVLSWSGRNYAYLPAVAANTLTSPNQSVTGNQPITFDIALNDYTPAADVTLFDKTSGNNGFAVKWLTTDKIRLVIGDGVGFTNVDVVASSSFTDGSRHTATIAWVDGVGATFSYDGVVSGSQVAAVKTLTNAAVVMTIGSATSIGKVYRMQVGSLYDMNAASATETTTNGATFTGGAGETWTLNNTGALLAQIVGSPQLLFDGTAHVMKASGFSIAQPLTMYFVGKQNTWASNTPMINEVDNYNAALFKSNTGVSPRVAMYGGAVAAWNDDLVLGTTAIVASVMNGTSSSIKVNNNTPTTGDISTGGFDGGIALGWNRTPTFGEMQIKELIARFVADNAATQLAIIQKLAAKHGISL